MRWILIIFLLCFIAIIGKLFTIQVLFSNENTFDYLHTNRLLPERGKIYDRKGELLAGNELQYIVYAEPRNMEEEDKEEVVETLDPILEIGESTLSAMLDNDQLWVPLKREVDSTTKEKIEKLELNGVGFEDYLRRYYPETSMSAHLLGFVGKDEMGDGVGYSGIEGFYDKELAGLPGFIKSERDALGRPIFIGTQERVKPEDGRDLVLTIDIAVQNIVKKWVVKSMEAYQPKEVCIIVADPMTMEILGLACAPDFDPEEYYKSEDKMFRNWSVSSVYEPGSTFKPLIMAAAIEEENVSPTSTFNEKGPVKMGEHEIKNWDDTYKGRITMTNVLEKSSNIGMVYVGEQLGREKVVDYIHAYGFGELTHIDLEGEIGGYIKPEETWYDIDYATATFGQGIAVTPIQLVRAFSSLVNGGYLLKPYVVREIVEPGRTRERRPEIVRQVISKETSEQIKAMLVSTVNHAEVPIDLPEGYEIGGKTGTAQIAMEGQYDAYRTITSFIGFAPVDNPQFIGLVVMKEPEVSRWGSETAAPVFFEVAKELLVYYNVVPDE